MPYHSQYMTQSRWFTQFISGFTGGGGEGGSAGRGGGGGECGGGGGGVGIMCYYFMVNVLGHLLQIAQFVFIFHIPKSVILSQWCPFCR